MVNTLVRPLVILGRFQQVNQLKDNKIDLSSTTEPTTYYSVLDNQGRSILITTEDKYSNHIIRGSIRSKGKHLKEFEGSIIDKRPPISVMVQRSKFFEKHSRRIFIKELLI